MKFRIEKRHCYLVTDSITKLEEVADNLIEVEFEFDAEWSGITKTARFSKGWEGEYVDKLITNGKCSVSLPYGEWYVGVMSTNLTTTPCKVEMGISEKSYNGYPAPAQSIYQQILDKLDSLSGADPDMVAEQIEAYFEEHPIDGLTDDDVNTLIAAYLEENPQGVDETAVNNLIASYLTANPQGLSESSVNSLIASYLTAHPQGVSESSVNTLIANYLTAHPQGLSESAVNGLIASYLTSNPQGLSETAVNNLIASYLTAHPQGVDESSVNNLIAAYITAHPEIGSGGGNKVAYAASATSDTIIKIVEEEGEEIDLSDEIADAVEDYFDENPVSENVEFSELGYYGIVPFNLTMEVGIKSTAETNISGYTNTGDSRWKHLLLEFEEGQYEKLWISGQSFDFSHYKYAMYIFYDADGNRVSYGGTDDNTTYSNLEVDVPTNATKLWVNGTTTNGASVGEKKYISFYANKKILFLGDSITKDASRWRSKFCSLVKCDSSVSVAVVGATWTDKEGTVYDGNPVFNGTDNNVNNVIGNQIQKIINARANNEANYSEFDSIIIACGTNDVGTIKNCTDDSILGQFTSNGLASGRIDLENADRKNIGGAMRYAIETLRGFYPNADIFVATPIQKAQTLVSDIVKAGDKIKFTANLLGVPVWDTEKCGIRGYLESEHIDLADGLHPNANGAKKIADYNAREFINYYMSPRVL